MNQQAAIVAGSPIAPIQVRWAAIVSLSVYNAAEGAHHDGRDAAIIAASHYALVHLLPAQAAALDAKYSASLASHGISASDPAIAIGESAAAAVLASRATDGASVAQFPYTAPGAGSPGVWVRTPPAFAPAVLPGWGSVTPFAIQSGSQFRPGPPPALTDALYANDLAETEAFGQNTSTVRTADETTVGKFWIPTAYVLLTPIARQLCIANGLSSRETARVLALTAIAGADASIATWDAKYHYNFWRPITAIRAGGTPPPATDNPTWSSLAPTPAFPEYPSGHTTFSGAMLQVLIQKFGIVPGVALDAVSPNLPGQHFTWTSLQTPLDDVVNARVWVGFHYRNSDVVGEAMGRCLGRFVYRHALRGDDGHGDGDGGGGDDGWHDDGADGPHCDRFGNLGGGDGPHDDNGNDGHDTDFGDPNQQ